MACSAVSCKYQVSSWQKNLHVPYDCIPSMRTELRVVQVHHVLVHGGPGGYEDFVSSIRRIFGITTELDMHLAFDCADPVSGVGSAETLSTRAPESCLLCVAVLCLQCRPACAI